MRNLFTPSGFTRFIDAATIALCALIVTLAVSAVAALDSSQPAYASYGYAGEVSNDDALARLVAASQAADAIVCRDLYGPNATALQLPDGSHRCVDKHGRRLSARGAISIPAHELAQR